MSRLTINGIALERYSPPRTEVNRSRRRMVLQQAAYNLDGSWWDFGQAESFYHVFQTQDDVGFVTAQQKKQLETLFEGGDTFTVVTDLLGNDETLETFSAQFDYASPPRYVPKLQDGSLWAFVLPLYLKLSATP